MLCEAYAYAIRYLGWKEVCVQSVAMDYVLLL